MAHRHVLANQTLSKKALDVVNQHAPLVAQQKLRHAAFRADTSKDVVSVDLERAVRTRFGVPLRNKLLE
jgi:hypothetical protein